MHSLKVNGTSSGEATGKALLAASNPLDVTAVREACGDYLKRHIDIHNCVGMHCLAETHSSAALEQHSMDYILEHFSDIYRQEEFLSLSVERLTAILSSDHLNGQEDMVFEAAMAWLMKLPTHGQSFESRAQSFFKVLEHIRLPLISPSYLRHVIKSLDVVKEHQGCQRFISEAKERLAVPYCNTARARRTTGTAADRPRSWFPPPYQPFYALPAPSSEATSAPERTEPTALPTSSCPVNTHACDLCDPTASCTPATSTTLPTLEEIQAA